MKVVFTVATYWPKTDGVQMVTQYHAEGLAKKGHQVIVFTSKMDGIPIQEEHNGVIIIRVDAYNYYYWHRGNKKEYVSLVKEQCNDADALVAVCLQSFAADWLLDDLSDITCKKVLYLHGMPDFILHLSECGDMKTLLKTIFRNIHWKRFYVCQLHKIKKFDAIIHLFENDNSHKYFRKHGYSQNFVIENACDDSFFDTRNSAKTTLSHEEQGGINHNYFLSVGNYCDRKNQALAIRAFYEAEDNGYAFILIGNQNNKYCQWLQKLKSDLDAAYGLRDVQIKYSVPREQIADYTKNAFACVMSSKYEYYPITIIESLASGLPFISTDVGIVRLLPGGVIVKNQDDLTYWMSFMMKNPKYAHDLGRIGKTYAEANFRIIDKVESLERVLHREDR